jgi:glycosyltransferase involved in cell wall biosynthesis
MKILHVSPSFYPTKAYGGTIRSSYGLCRGLSELGCQVRVLTTDTDGIGRNLQVPSDRDIPVDGVQVRYCHKLARNSVSPSLLRVLREYVRWADVVHLIAVYSFPTFPTLTYCRVLEKPLVWSPRGSLQRWDGTTRLATKFLWEQVCQALVLKQKVILHTTSEDENDQSKARFAWARTATIPNGVELPDEVRRTGSPASLRLTYLGRLHPIKGIESLLDACKLIQSDSEPWQLRIAGSGAADYLNALRSKVHQLQLQDRVEFVGEVSGDVKEELFANSDVLIAPSFVENFGMVIAEALAREVPVIAGKGTPWQDVQKYGCGLWVGNDPESLANGIRKIRKMPLREMGQRGRCWMRREFSWESVSRKMLEVYGDCCRAKASPLT